MAFSVFGCKEKMYRCAQEGAGPVILGSVLKDSWFADFERENGKIKRAIAVGPFGPSGLYLSKLERIVQQQGIVLSLANQQELLHALGRTDYISLSLLAQYALMLHYLLTGEALGISSVSYADDGEVSAALPGTHQKDRNEVWLSEQGLMRMVREGDLNYKQAMDNTNGVSDGVGLTSDEPLRKTKTSVIVFTSLCVRAAIEGGLSPEVSYSLGDAYIQSTEDAATFSEISAISSRMYDDFVHRVHQCHVNPNLSKPIRICCDYIEQNAEGDLSMSAIAARVGYTEYYLSRRFKEEVHVSITKYIQIVRVERAKFLLGCTGDSIQAISDRLHFCSRSYFGEVFRKIVGCSPVEYRENYKKG